MERHKHYNEIIAWAEGKTIEYRDEGNTQWAKVPEGHIPTWVDNCEYRVAVTPPSIDWGAVNKDYKYLAIDRDDGAFLYTVKPVLHDVVWTVPSPGRCLAGVILMANVFSSFDPGNIPWQESLIERPQDE